MSSFTAQRWFSSWMFWSRARARQPAPETADEPGSQGLDSDLSAEIESPEFQVAAISGRPSGVPSLAPGSRHASGLHSRLSLEPSQTIYHVGGRETPTDDLLSSQTHEHLHDLCLRLVGGEERARVILVASESGARAAKSRIAAQLASMLGRDYGPNVLAMEADPTAPALHNALGFAAPRGYGLCEQLQRLSGEQRGRVSIVRLDQRLAALVASDPSTVTREWQACFHTVLTQLRTEHEYIILDGPAVGSEADLAHLQQADGVLFVASQGTKLTQTLATVTEHLPNSPLIRIVEQAAPSAERATRSSWRTGLRKR